MFDTVTVKKRHHEDVTKDCHENDICYENKDVIGSLRIEQSFKDRVVIRGLRSVSSDRVIKLYQT